MLIASSVISISSSKWQAQVIGAITNMTQIMGVNTTINNIGKSIKGKIVKKNEKKARKNGKFFFSSVAVIIITSATSVTKLIIVIQVGFQLTRQCWMMMSQGKLFSRFLAELGCRISMLTSTKIVKIHKLNPKPLSSSMSTAYFHQNQQ